MTAMTRGLVSSQLNLEKHTVEARGIPGRFGQKTPLFAGCSGQADWSPKPIACQVRFLDTVPNYVANGRQDGSIPCNQVNAITGSIPGCDISHFWSSNPYNLSYACDVADNVQVNLQFLIIFLKVVTILSKGEWFMTLYVIGYSKTTFLNCNLCQVNLSDFGGSNWRSKPAVTRCLAKAAYRFNSYTPHQTHGRR